MNYKELPDSSRVWIYQSDRKFSSSEIESIKEQGDNFVEKWNAHGEALNSAFEIFHDRFVILFADEDHTKPGGCSIDRAVRFIKTLEEEYRVSLMNRNIVAYKDGDNILTLAQEEFFEQFAQGKLTEDTIVFNNLVTTKGELESKWQVPLKESWHADLIQTK